MLNENPSAVGLQEMNEGADLSIEVISNHPFIKANYNVFKACVPANSACILTLWRKDLGEKEKSYHADLGETPDISYGQFDKGRPISIIQTTKGYVLINLHSPNKPDDSLKNNANMIRKAIAYHYNEAKLSLPVKADKVYVMGDFNDPHHAINDDMPLKLSEEITLTTGRKQEDKILSCCYNWNSCGQPPLAKGEASRSLGEAGALTKYIFTGDYCLGANVVYPLRIVKSPVDGFGASTASDHELVYATFQEISAGGGRKKQTRRSKNKRRSSKSKRKSRK